jgi:L-fuconolactonase
MMGTIDAHAHLWDRDRFRYDWLDHEENLPASFLPEDLLATGPAIEAFVFVQADCEPEEGYGEAAWVQSLAPVTPGLAGIVAFAPLERSFARPALAALSELPLVVGVRRLLQAEDQSFFELESLSHGLEEVARRGWTFDACVRWHQLEDLYRLARRHEALPFVLDHLGKPPLNGGPDEFTSWCTMLAKLAELPNTTVKLSGLPAEARVDASAGSFGPWIRAAYDLFGPHRSMIGSDWPVSSRTSLTRGGWVDTVKSTIGAEPSEWIQVAGLTAERVYRLPRGD